MAPVRKPLPERGERNKADAELLEGRQDFLLRLPPPERILALQGRHGLHGVRPADGSHTGFGQPEMPDLALLDQILDGSRHVLDRHGGIDAMLIEQIDAIGPEPLQGGLGDLSDVLRPAVEAELAELLAECMTELGRDHDLVAERGEGLADNFLILVRAVCLGGIEEGDAALDGRRGSA